MLVRTIKTWWLIAAFVSGFGLAMWAEDLALSWRNNYLEFSAPHMHFLTGKPLERLQHGAQVPFDFKVSLYSGTKNHLFSPARRTIPGELRCVGRAVFGGENAVAENHRHPPRCLGSRGVVPAPDAHAPQSLGTRDTEKLWAQRRRSASRRQQRRDSFRPRKHQRIGHQSDRINRTVQPPPGVDAAALDARCGPADARRNKARQPPRQLNGQVPSPALRKT